MASPVKIREFRFMEGTSFNVGFGDATATTGIWDPGAEATKLRVIAYDDSGLTREGIADETLQTRMHAKPAPIPGLLKGTLKFSTYAGGSFSNATPTPECLLMNCSMGGIISPTTKSSVSVGAAPGTMSVWCNGGDSSPTFLTGVAQAGQGVLLGRRGDGRGGGEHRTIQWANGNLLNFVPAIAAAMIDADPIVFAHTVFFDEGSTQRYIDTLGIGHATADQRQTIGGAVKFTVGALQPGALPKIDFEVPCADHRIVPSGARASLTTTTAVRGNDPALGGIGYVHVGDCQASTRTERKSSTFVVTPGQEYMEIPNPAGPNGIGGWQKMPSAPTLEMSMLYDEDEPGLTDDFNAKVPKSVVLQIGHALGKAVAFDMPRSYLAEQPVPTDMAGLSGVKYKFVGDDNNITTNTLTRSPLRIHIY